MSPAELGRMISSDFAKYVKIFNEEGIKPE
jgi:hypothetical protein